MNDEEQNKSANFDNENECFVLFESCNELIVLHRNMRRQVECIVMTQNLIDKLYNYKKHWCIQAEYYQILPHQQKIQKYLTDKGDIKLFNAFFKMSIEQFFGAISMPVAEDI